MIIKPEPFERRTDLIRGRVEGGGIFVEEAGEFRPPSERRMEQSIEFDGLPTAGGHDFVADPGVHPGQLESIGSLIKQSVRRIDLDSVPCSSSVGLEDRINGGQNVSEELISGRLVVAPAGRPSSSDRFHE